MTGSSMISMIVAAAGFSTSGTWRRYKRAQYSFYADFAPSLYLA